MTSLDRLADRNISVALRMGTFPDFSTSQQRNKSPKYRDSVSEIFTSSMFSCLYIGCVSCWVYSVYIYPHSLGVIKKKKMSQMWPREAHHPSHFTWERYTLTLWITWNCSGRTISLIYYGAGHRLINEQTHSGFMVGAQCKLYIFGEVIFINKLTTLTFRIEYLYTCSIARTHTK